MGLVVEAERPTTLNTDALLATYAEIGKSYHAIDDFRMKLLGLLPLTSVAGILLLNQDQPILSGAAGTPAPSSRLCQHRSGVRRERTSAAVQNCALKPTVPDHFAVSWTPFTYW
jgi:hypothetical protein